jgi:hypothetical protein
MAEFDEIGQYIQDIATSGMKIHSIPGIVEKVDKVKLVCSVKSMDESETFVNVKLKDITDMLNPLHGFILIPKQGSRVIVDKSGIGMTYISMMSEVELMYSVVGDSSNEIRLGISKTGLSLENTKNTADLKETLDKLIDTLSKLQVQTAWGPSGPPLDDYVNELSDIKESLAKIIVKGSDNKPQ